MKRYSLVFLAVLWSACHAYGQAVGGNTALEATSMPNASKGSIGGDIVNVDLYTGTGSVNIPIINAGADGINLGVSLGYSLKGIRVDEIASEVGLGWQLITGGSVTRQVNGIEDEVTLPAKFTLSDYGSALGMGYHDSIQGIMVPNVLTQSTLDALAISHPYGYHVYDDDEPDAFNFNLCGRQVTVYFEPGANRTDSTGFRTEPYSRIKIELISKDCVGFDLDSFTNFRPGLFGKGGQNLVNDVLSFVVTDEKGNKFYFDRGDVSFKKMHLDPAVFTNYDATYYPVERWNLVKLITYSGLQVNYSFSQPSTYQYVHNISEFKSPLFGGCGMLINKDTLSGFRNNLESIYLPHGDVISLEYDDIRCDCQTTKRLKNISISGCTNAGAECITNRYNLQQAFFNTPIPNFTSTEIAIPANLTACSTLTNQTNLPLDPNVYTQKQIDSIRMYQLSRGLRLKLKGIMKYGNSGSGEQYYQFAYNTTPLPHRFSPSKDIYGYANGESYPTWSCDDTTNLTLSMADIQWGLAPSNLGTGVTRKYDFTAAQSSILNRITNGRGGITEVEFQNYYLSNPDSSYGVLDSFPYCGAGANLIPSYVIGPNIDANLEFDTLNDGLCIRSVIQHDQFLKEDSLVATYSFSRGERFNRGGYTWLPKSEPSQAYIKTNTFVNPLQLYNGSNHGFGEVVVTTTGFQKEILAKRKYYFTNLMYKENWISKSSMRKVTGKPYHTLPGELNKTRMGLNTRIEEFDSSGYMSGYKDMVYKPVSYGAAIRVSRYLSYAFPYVDTTAPNYSPSVCQFSIKKYNYRINDTFFMRLDTVYTVKRIRDLATSTDRLFKSTESYQYDSKNRVSMLSWEDSKGDGYNNLFTYTAPPFRDMLLHTQVWKGDTASGSLKSLQLNVPVLDGNGYVHTPVTFSTAANALIPYSQVATSVNMANAINYGSNTSFGTKFKMVKKISLYDTEYNPLEIYYPQTDNYVSNIWDTVRNQIIAQVSNARQSDIAHTSFEGSYAALGSADRNKGNFDFDPAKIGNPVFILNGPGNAMTGNMVYELTQNSSGYSYIRTRDITTAGTYLLSFWISSTSAPVVEYTNGSTTTTVTAANQNTVGNWKLYTAQITAASGSYVKIHNTIGTGSSKMYADEVRFYPKGASMSTVTYRPLCGVSSVCDESNYISYNTYDNYGRLIVTKDMRGNVVSQIEHGINSPDNN